MSAIECQDVCKSYDGSRVLSNLSFNVNPGEIFVLLGSSGCGKTTTLKLLAGLDEPDSGTIRLGGKEASAPDIRIPAHKRNVAMVFQSLALWPQMTVEQNLLFVLRSGGGHARRIERARAMLALFRLEDKHGMYPGDLSQGEAQRVAIARALLQEPDILLLDEPFSNLDYALRSVLLEELRRLQRERKVTMVYVTHHQEEAMVLADRLAVMRGGVLEQIGTPDAIYSKPASSYVASFIGINNILEGRVEGNQILTVVGPAGQADGGVNGGPVLLAVRPNALAVSPQAAHRGQVVDSRFLGRHWLITVEIDGTAVKVEHEEPFDRGAEIGIALASEPYRIGRSPETSKG